MIFCMKPRIFTSVYMKEFNRVDSNKHFQDTGYFIIIILNILILKDKIP